LPIGPIRFCSAIPISSTPSLVFGLNCTSHNPDASANRGAFPSASPAVDDTANYGTNDATLNTAL
jgi:hypothetical protein